MSYFIYCRNLRDTDLFSKSDPIAILLHKPFSTDKWVELGRTECIDNTLNPDFAKKFPIVYRFEEQQHLKFMLYDIDSNDTNMSQHDFLGEFECSLASLVSVGKTTKPLTDKSSNVYCGEIIIISEELNSCKEELSLKFVGKGLKNPNWFSGLSTFIEFYKANEDNSSTLVHRTEHSRGENPSWKEFKVQLRSFCSGDYDRTLKVNCREFKTNGSHKFIGSFTTNVRDLMAEQGASNVFLLIDEDKKVISFCSSYIFMIYLLKVLSEILILMIYNL